MPAMPNGNARSDYVACGRKRNHPRINHLICENNCSHIKKCIYYANWYEDYYGEPLKKKRKRRVKK